MELQKQLDDKILERQKLIQSNIKNNTFSIENDGSFKIRLESLNTEIGQLQDNILKEIYE